MRRRHRGFTLAECMIALLFISIGLFAYVSLHVRLIHSGLKLEVRVEHQEGVRSKMAEQIAKARQGMRKINLTNASTDGNPVDQPQENSSTLMSMDPNEGRISLMVPDPNDGGFKLVRPENGLVPYYDSSYKPFMPYYNSGYIPFRPYYNPLDLNDSSPGTLKSPGGSSLANVSPIGTGATAAQKIEVQETWTDRNGEQRIVLESAVAPLYQGW